MPCWSPTREMTDWDGAKGGGDPGGVEETKNWGNTEGLEGKGRAAGLWDRDRDRGSAGLGGSGATEDRVEDHGGGRLMSDQDAASTLYELGPLWTACLLHGSTDHAHDLLRWREISGLPIEESAPSASAMHEIAYLPGGWYMLCCLFKWGHYKWGHYGLLQTSFSSRQFICHLTFVHVLNSGLPSQRAPQLFSDASVVSTFCLIVHIVHQDRHAPPQCTVYLSIFPCSSGDTSF